MFKILVFFNKTEERINPFATGYMTNPTLHVNKVFRDQVEKCLKYTFYQITMKVIKC